MAKIANIDIKVERAAFDRAIKRLIKVSPKLANEIVTDAAEAFMRTAAKETPPQAGKTSISASKYKRTIVKKTNDDISKSDRIALKLGRRAANVYIVTYRTLKKRGNKLFTKKNQAQEFAKIKYRGIARAGWFLGLVKIGKSLSSAHQAIMRKSPYIDNKPVNITRRISNNNDYAIEVTNQAEAIDRIAKKSEVWGLRKAKNKINAAAKTLRKRLEDQWPT